MRAFKRSLRRSIRTTRRAERSTARLAARYEKFGRTADARQYRQVHSSLRLARLDIEAALYEIDHPEYE